MQQPTLSDKDDKQLQVSHDDEYAIDSIVILDTRYVCCGMPPCKREHEQP